MMDNRIFNVNGRGEELLSKTLDLVMSQYASSYNKSPISAWKHSKQYGLILYWFHNENDESTPLPCDTDAKGILPIVLDYLSSDKAKEVETRGWDSNSDHDGHNKLGWRVYCEDWGKIDHSHYAICAIKPAYMWYGK